MKVIKQPWFLILVFVASIYTYQFYTKKLELKIGVTTAEAAKVVTDSDFEGQSDEPKVQPSKRVGTTESFKAKAVKSFKLSTYFNVNLKIEPADISEVTINFIGEGATYRNTGEKLGDWYDVRLKKGTLELVNFSKPKNKSLKDLTEIYTDDEKGRFQMVVQVPQKFKFKDITLEVINTNLIATDIQFTTLEVASVNGDLTLKNTIGTSVEYNTVSGDGILEVKNLKRADINSVTGDAKIQILNPKTNFTMNTVSGDLVLKLPKDSDVNVNFNSMTGSLANDFGSSSKGTNSLEFSSLSGSAEVVKIQ